MSYAADRDKEQLAQLDEQVSQFIARYRQHRPARRKTVILFPGGMGSSIKWATTSQGNTPYFYNLIWLDCPILTGGALLLKMKGDDDAGRHFVIADGCVRFPPMLVPYDDFLSWCTSRKFDWFVFGWDWRRDPELVARFFLKSFVPKFRQRVRTECGTDPFADVTLIGHSFGGMVVKLVLNQGGSHVAAIRRAISVGSPFYGYAGQLNRYFKGDPDLDRLSWSYDPRNLTQLISSLPGPYTLLYLDQATFQRDQAALASDPKFPLSRYPVRDHDTGSLADPYNPQKNGTQVRYPENWGFSHVALDRGKSIYEKVALPLGAATNSKFYNIRGIQQRNGRTVNETTHEQTWDWIDPAFDPNSDPSPIVDHSYCPGDGVIPAWSSRLVSTLAANVRTVTGDIDRDGFEHMDLMLSPQIRAQILNIMQ